MSISCYFPALLVLSLTRVSSDIEVSDLYILALPFNTYTMELLRQINVSLTTSFIIVVKLVLIGDNIDNNFYSENKHHNAMSLKNHLHTSIDGCLATGSALVSINVVALRRTRSVLGWATVPGFNCCCGKFINSAWSSVWVGK